MGLLYENYWFEDGSESHTGVSFSKFPEALLAGLKETLRRLKAGELVLIFPEGTRTRDGEVAPLKPGFISVARRSRVPLIPVGLDGCYQAWPRTSRFPRGGRVAVVIGAPIGPDVVEALSDDDLLAELEQRILTSHTMARELRTEAV